ncbi:MAG: hypothetical protein HY777_04745 [Betaproteobacteria bacterium]|nr:hypothetical protein [Betaproteobacteria bacterium]
MRDELIARLTTPFITCTHRTTGDLTFNDPATGREKVIPSGTLCRLVAYQEIAELDFENQWAAKRNLQHGYCLIWLDGMLRGVAFKDAELLPEFTQERIRHP